MYEWIEKAFEWIVRYGMLMLEFTGVVIILYTAVKCIIELILKRECVRLDLAKGIALALEFKLGSEVLRTAITRDLDELLITGAIIALRAAMTFMIHWEIKIEEARLG